MTIHCNFTSILEFLNALPVTLPRRTLPQYLITVSLLDFLPPLHPYSNTLSTISFLPYLSIVAVALNSESFNILLNLLSILTLVNFELGAMNLGSQLALENRGSTCFCLLIGYDESILFFEWSLLIGLFLDGFEVSCLDDIRLLITKIQNIVIGYLVYSILFAGIYFQIKKPIINPHIYCPGYNISLCSLSIKKELNLIFPIMFTLQGLTMTAEAFGDEQNLERCLSRLKQSIEDKPIEQLMSSFGYTANLMDRYLSSETRDMKKSYYLIVFTKIIEGFRLRVAKEEKHQQLTISKCKQQILHNILNALQQYSEVKDFYTVKETVSTIQLQETFKETYRNIQNDYEDHNLDKAHAQIGRFNKLKAKWPELEVTRQMAAKINKIERQYQKMCWFYSQLGGDDWIFDKEQDNIRLEYRVHEEERTISVRMYAQIDMEMLPFLAIASEIDFQKEYVPFVYVSEEVKPLGRNRKAGYSKTYVPLLTDRQCYFSAVGYDRMDTTGSIFLYTESYDEDYELQRQYNLIVPKPQDSEYVRLKVHYFCIDYKPLSKKRAQIRLVTKADFKLTFLPLWILQRSARIFTFNYFQKIVQKAKNFKGSVWQERVKQKPAMYNFFQKKIQQYFK